MKIHRALAGAVLMVAPVIAISSSASAGNDHADRPIRVTYTYQNAGANFTDCPIEGVLVDTDCIGTGVFAQTITSRVGKVETRSTTLYVDLFVVHFHPDGTFEIEATPFASGSGPGRLEAKGVRWAKVRGDVPLSDGTTAEIGMWLDGTGPITPFSGAGVYPEPGCPSGEVDLSWTGAFRDAVAYGKVVVGASVQEPTIAIGPASLAWERDWGTCTTVPI